MNTPVALDTLSTAEINRRSALARETFDFVTITVCWQEDLFESEAPTFFSRSEQTEYQHIPVEKGYIQALVKRHGGTLHDVFDRFRKYIPELAKQNERTMRWVQISGDIRMPEGDTRYETMRFIVPIGFDWTANTGG